MTARSRLTAGAALAALGALLVLPVIAGAQDGEGFDGYIQSGTCAAPTDDLRVQLKSDGDHDVKPYVARRYDGTVELGYYGSPLAPGFGFALAYADQPFSLVIADTETGDPVACGDILEPDAQRFAEAGMSVVQLLPVGDSTVQGVAVIQRAPMQRELDVTPTSVRIVLSTDTAVTAPAASAVGFDGYITGGTCAAPTDRMRIQLKGRGDHDVRPFVASHDSGEPVTVAYYGAPLAPGFGLAVAYTDQSFSLVITDTDTGDPVACGDILAPDSDDLARAGVALVQLLPVGDTGMSGYALIERMPMHAELDITPTRVRIVLFAPAGRIVSGHIVPMGAGLAVMQRRNDPLHDYVLELTGKDDPRVLFLPTATGDDASYIVTFYEAFHSGRCRPQHLRLFHRDFDDLTEIVLGADVIHVGGGNTANMLDVWRRQGVDTLLHQALAGGAVLTGGSAGGLCWFEGGTTDSFGPTLQLLHEGLGMIKGSYCPHYDAEDQRRPLFHAALLDGSLEMGYASWNRVAIRFTPGGEVVEAVTSEDGGRALKVYARDGEIVEEDIPCRRLEGARHQPFGVHLSDVTRDASGG